jgi:hypothetical protein
MWSMTWHPFGPIGQPVRHSVWPPVGHPVWPPRLATSSGHPLGTPSGPIGHPIWPPRLATRRESRLATPSGHPSGTPSGPCRAPRPAPFGTPIWPPLGTPSGTLVSSRGSGRPSISEPLDRCPFGPLTVALPFTYIKPSNPPLHHFLHSPICIGTCDCGSTVALHGSWSLGAGSNCWVQALPVFFPQFTQENDGA